MARETPSEQPGDETTAAIYDVVNTLGSEGSGPAGERVPPGIPAERQNEPLEDDLIAEGVFGKRGLLQRQVLGCLGCKLTAKPGTQGEIRSRDIAVCTGSDNSTVRRILRRLRDSGHIESEVRVDRTKAGRNPEWVKLTPAGADRSFKGRLQAPEQCGLRTGHRQLNTEAEQLLIDRGILETHDPLPRVALGCLACRLQTGEGIHVDGLGKCQGVSQSGTLRLFRKLVGRGVLQANIEERHIQGHPRTLYTPANTELGAAVAELLEVPERCGLDGEQFDGK